MKKRKELNNFILKNKSGLATIELIMIFAIIIAISFIISFIAGKFEKINEIREFENFQSKIIEASNEYIEKYREVLPASELCINVPFQNLQKENMIEETDFECNKDGVISIYQDQTNDNYELYLTCRNVHNDEIVYQKDGNPVQCIRANGNFAIQIVSAKEIKNETLQDYISSNWSSGNIRIELTAYNPFFYPIQEYQYSLDNGITYEKVNGTELILDRNFNGKIKIRAMDTNHDYSTEKSLYIKLDKTVPSVIINATDALASNIESNTYASGNVILSASLENNPISFVNFDWYSCANVTDVNSCSQILENSTNYQATSNGIYRVRAITEAGLYSYSEPFEVKIDKSVYQIKNETNDQSVTLINNSTGIRSTSQISARIGDQITITISQENHLINAIYDKSDNLVYGTKMYQFGNKSNTFIMDRSDMTITSS